MNPCKTHKFVKFDEDRIFCERCGLFMLAARYAPTYIPDWTFRTYPPYWAPTVTAPSPRPFITVWNGTNTTAGTVPQASYTITSTAGGQYE